MERLRAEADRYWACMTGVEKTLFRPGRTEELPSGEGLMVHTTWISKADTGKILAYCRRSKVTVATYIHAAFGRVICEFTRKDRACFFTTADGRPDILTADNELFGMFACGFPFIYEKDTELSRIQLQLARSREYGWAYRYPERTEGGFVLDIQPPQVAGTDLIVTDLTPFAEAETAKIIRRSSKEARVCVMTGDRIRIVCMYESRRFGNETVISFVNRLVRNMRRDDE